MAIDPMCYSAILIQSNAEACCYYHKYRLESYMANTNGKVRLGFVGLGNYAYHMGKCAQQCDNIEVAACFTRTPAKREKFASQFECANLTSFEAMCDDQSINGVVLVTPNDVHCPQTEALAAAGKHIFTEKPMCNTVEEADRMIEACNKTGVILAVGHQERRESVYRKIKSMIDNGEFGRVNSFETCHCGDLIKAWPADDWRFTSDQGVGPILHKGIHKIDVLNYLFGELEAVSTLSCKLEVNPEMNETTVSTMKYEGDVLGSLTTSFRFTTCSLHIYGEKKSIAFSGYGDTMTVKDEEKWEFEDVSCGKVDETVEELAEFAGAILGKCRVEVDGVAGRQAVAAGVAAKLAADKGDVIYMKDVM